jgi:type VI secretion system protein ImpG
MRDDLLLYYDRELRFIRKTAMAFAEKYPDMAGRLLLEPTKCEDPHVERLIEAFAMLTARVHLRLDDDFAELSHAMLEILYPPYLRPIPSATIVQLSLDPDQGAAGGGLEIERHSLLRSRPVEGVRCAFRTCYDTRLWPIEVASVELQPVTGSRAALPPDARSMLRIRLQGERGVPLSDLSIPSLRFFLSDQGESLQVLHEMFLRDAVALGVQWGSGGTPAILPAEYIRPVGFGEDEGLLEYPKESFRGYRLLQEYFAFPEKFLFVELAGLDRAHRDAEQAQDHLELNVFLRRSMATIDVRFSPENLQLGCVPAVNLFPHRPDPVRLTHQSVEYPIVPDARSPYSYEVYSITNCAVTGQESNEARDYLPFYGVQHGSASAGDTAYWHAARRESIRKDDPGTDVFISLVDPAFHPMETGSGVVHLDTLCTNRDLPARLPFGDQTGDFQLEGRPEVARIVCLRKPTSPLRAPMQRDARWRVVSHLALNHLSLTGRDTSALEPDVDDASSPLSALREVLRVYDFTDSPAMRQRIAGLVGLRSRKVLRRTGRGALSGFARGVEVELEFDEDQYTGTGALLFALVLERFLGLYATINSFTQTVAVTRQREEPLKRWPPRAGEIQLQ